MVALQSACCCLSLRTGNLILGWLHLLCGIIVIIALAVSIPQIDKLNPEEFSEGATKEDVKIILCIVLAISCLSPIFAICHIYGSIKYRKEFLIPYLVMGGLQIVVLIGSIIFSIVRGVIANTISGIIGLLISIYFYLIPWSFYKEIRSGLQPPQNQVS